MHWTGLGYPQGPRARAVNTFGPESMLSVRIDGREVETTPISLARLVFEGRADRHCPARTPGTTAERSLEQSLESPHCEALSDELLCRLRSMYASELPAVDIRELCERVERLCQWRWTNPHIAARFFWAAAWLNDVLDRLESAAELYDTFLQTSSREEHLRLLAYNNRGVLRIRLGRLEGVVDLARAAIPTSAGGMEQDRSRVDPGTGNPPSKGLPAACFNLLNLINVSLECGGLTRAVDEELAEFFSQLPEDSRTFWLGGETAGETRAEDSDSSFVILRDPTYRRLNTLTTRLAAGADNLVGREISPATGRLAASVSQLLLWESRSIGEERPGNGRGTSADLFVDGSYGYCAEAASLLLSDEVPSSLTRLESPLARAEQAAREELASIESRLTLNQYEFVRSRLHVQRRILSSLNRRGRLAGLIARVDAQLERVAHLESQSEQLDLQRACAGLISGVEQFCRLTDLCRARREHDDLLRRLQQVRSGLDSQTGGDTAVLFDELTGRLNRHLDRLMRLEARRGIRNPLRVLRQNWPQDRASPVPEAVYQALGQCHLGDPECRVEDWTALKERLDGHQGLYYLHKALALLRAGQVSRNEVDEDLIRSLLLKPDLWPTIAPLFGLSRPSESSDSQGTTTDIQLAMLAAASRVFEKTPEKPDGPEGAGGDGPLHRAGALLERVLEQMDSHADRCMELWRCVSATLSPVLEREDLDAIAQVKGLAERCLDHWPMGRAELPGRVDPRHPVNLFLESCEKARRLVEAGQWLNARPPRWDEAGKCYGDLLVLGLDTRSQLRRAVTGHYLALCHEQDAPPVQRQVLAGLEAWVAGKPQEAVQGIREQDVAREIARLRAAVPAARKASIAEPGQMDRSAGGSDCRSNDSKGGGWDPQEESKPDA